MAAIQQQQQQQMNSYEHKFPLAIYNWLGTNDIMLFAAAHTKPAGQK